MACLAPQQKAERSAITQARWKLLSDADIDEILSEAKLDGSEEAKKRLRESINERLAEFGRFTDYRKDHSPSGKIEAYQRISTLAGKLLHSVNEDPDIYYALRYEWDRVYQSVVSKSAGSTEENSATTKPETSFEELRAEFPGESELLIQAIAQLGLRRESPESRAAVHSIIRSVVLLRGLADRAVATQESVQTKQQTKQIPRKVDEVRLGLVSAVAWDFELVLKVKTTTALGGHWLKFLAAMLSRCEDQSLSPEGAKTLWLKTRKWQQEN